MGRRASSVSGLSSVSWCTHWLVLSLVSMAAQGIPGGDVTSTGLSVQHQQSLMLGPVMAIFEMCPFLRAPGPFEQFSENG